MSADDAAAASGRRYVVLSTVPNTDVAAQLARSLVDAHLAACVNVVPGVVSHYRWEGRVHRDDELLLVIKTDGSRLRQLIEAIEREHPYEVAEAIALPIDDGSEAYMRWITASVAADPPA